MSSGDDAPQRDERRTKSDADLSLRLPPLKTIAPRHSEDFTLRADRQSSDSPLPAISDLGLPKFDQLLQQGRGVYVPPPIRSQSESDKSLECRGHRLVEYTLKDSDQKSVQYSRYVMQAPHSNENHAKYTLINEAGRSISYVLDVAQPPKQARACGNGPRCECSYKQY